MSQGYRCHSCFEIIGEQEVCPHCGYTQNTPPKELSHLFPGTMLAKRYIIGKTVGFGGFGITYRAFDQKLERVVAVKEYYPCGVANRVPPDTKVSIYAKKRTGEYNYGKERFLDEAHHMAKFSTESNIINIYEYFEENNTAYIVMEFLEGVPLSGFLQQNGEKLDVAAGIEIAENIGNALTKIHSEGIVHRDVSPDNIFLCLDGSQKLIDFGAARFSLDEKQQMTIILKPGFAPPEQYEQINEQGSWTDVYALGATLYYTLTGQKPEESTNRKINDSVPYPHTINDQIPEHISNAIMKAMAIELHLRYKTVEEFLGAIRGEKKVIPIETEKKRRKQKRMGGIAAAAVVLLAGTAFAATNWNKEKEEETLAPCTIEMCYLLSGETETDEAKKEALESIITDFNTSFPDVTIELTAYSSEGSIDTDTFDGIFEYNASCDAKLLELSEAYQSDAAKECPALKNVKDKTILPLGFTAPAIYEALFNETDDAAGTVTDVNVLADLLGTTFSETAWNDFTSGKVSQYVAMTDSYAVLSADMPVRILPMEAEEIPCAFTDCWAATDSGKAENAAKIKLLSFMLTNNAQDALHLRGVDGNLPVNDSALTIYTQVYDDFEGFFDNSDCYVYNMEVSE